MARIEAIIPEPMTASEFCDFWIPKFLNNKQLRSQFGLLGLDEDQAGYKAERVRFLQKLIGAKKTSTIYRWLKHPTDAPLETRLFLGALNANWMKSMC